VDGDFASSQYLTPDFIGSGRDNGFLLLGASLMLEDGPLSATAWARNITNEVVYSGGFRYSFSRPRAAGGDPTLFYANIRPPRTYGITFRAGF
jgi:hypothetical protein